MIAAAIILALVFAASLVLSLALCRVAAIGDRQTIVDERRGEQ